MHVQDLRLTFFLFILKLLGGFPYFIEEKSIPERTVQQESNTNSTRLNKVITLKQSRFWYCWSITVILGVIIFALNATYGMFFLSDSVLQWFRSNTFVLAFKVDETCATIFVSLMVIYITRRGSLLMKLTLFLVKMFEHVDIPLMRPYCFGQIMLPMTAISVGTTVQVICYVALNSAASNTNLRLRIPEIIVAYLINVSLVGFFAWLVYLLCRFYASVIHDLLSISEEKKKNKDCLNIETGGGNILRIAGLDQTAEIPPAIFNYRFLAVQRKLYNGIEFKKLLNEYFGFIVVIFMLYLIFSCILASFIISNVSSTNPISLTMAGAYVVNTVIPLVAVPMVTRLTDEKIEDMRLISRRLQYDPIFRSERTQFRDILRLMQRTPPFNICNLFILNRGLIINVFGFIATYLIILLQFSFIEGTSPSEGIQSVDV
ncbi:hypothetical protein SK128_028618 [Halocaridina rubra]|uniref:Gustatory receptor n=1 Tax=Halocaridina rubra TaxID=373956 RepID=A0AAN9A7X4_HALRR